MGELLSELVARGSQLLQQQGDRSGGETTVCFALVPLLMGAGAVLLIDLRRRLSRAAR